MNEICTFAVDRRWPAQHPERLQVYSPAAPTGLSVSIMLEETGLPYELHAIRPDSADERSPEWLLLNPESRIPAIIDPDGPDDAPLQLSDSGAILFYLAEKTGKLMPAALSDCYQTIQWLFFQPAALAPSADSADGPANANATGASPRLPLHRRNGESRRLLGIVESRLDGRDWIMDCGYSIADIAMLGWVRQVTDSCDPAELAQVDGLPLVCAWMQRCLQRPAVQRGFKALGLGDDGVLKTGRPASGMPAF